MSGYHVHELCLTRFGEPASAVLRRARNFLYQGYALIENAKWGALLEIEGPGRGEYAVLESFDPTDEELDDAVEMGYGVQISQDVKLLKHHYTTVLMIVPGDRVGLIWKLESYIFDELHEWEGRGAWNQQKKTALANYVFGLARACGAEGFVLKRDRDELRTYTVKEIRHAMQHYERDSPLSGAALRGVEIKYLSLDQLRRVSARGQVVKHHYTVFGLYTVSDHMFPSDEPW